jgi:uncharacterized protein YgiM (DUF1202 family)
VGLITYLHDISLSKIGIDENRSKPQLQKSIEQLAFVNDPDGWVNLRSFPSATSSILTTLDNGDKVQILNKEGNWFKVKTIQNNIGYIYIDRLEMIK